MASALESILPHRKCLLLFFNLSQAGASEELNRWQAAMQGKTTVEYLDAGHLVLIIHPGWVAP